MTDKPFLRACRKMTAPTPPVWLMRQAGRYLPEYREIRARQGSFLDLVYTPDLAAEITVQPIRRFGMDAAILFSDILVIPDALGQRVEFIESKGPVLEAIDGPDALSRLNRNRFDTTLAPVYETVRQTKSQLVREGFDKTALIGFSGSPWTLACYMVEGGSSRDFIAVKKWAYEDPNGFSDLIDLLSDAVIDYLLAQIEAGVEAIQLFESWAGILDHAMFNRFVIQPTRRIVDAVHERHPGFPVIGYPRAAGRLALDYAQQTNISVLGLDQQTAPKWAASVFQSLLPVQGNMDPVCLLAGGAAMQNAAEDILAHLGQGPFIFNLGHGVIKETPPDHVEQLVRIIRNWG